jgi:hypothetical protein
MDRPRLKLGRFEILFEKQSLLIVKAIKLKLAKPFDNFIPSKFWMRAAVGSIVTF